jgi:hypothetical protein
MRSWPATADELLLAQQALVAAQPAPWHAPVACSIGACFVCFTRNVRGRGAPGEPGWAGAALAVGARIVTSAAVEGVAGASYEAGLLALREGPLLEAAVRALPRMPDVLLWRFTLARSSDCRPLASRTGRCWPAESGRQTSQAPGALWRSKMRRSRAGFAPAVVRGP